MAQHEAELKHVSHTDIDFGARRREDYGDLEELAHSIKEKGLIQPIAIWRKDTELAADEPPYLLLAGGRRYQATLMAGMVEVPCRIYGGEMSDLLYREIELHENIDRKDLSWKEQVMLKKEIHDLMIAKHGHKIAKGNENTTVDIPGWSQADTADLLGISTANVSKDLSLANALEMFPALGDAKNKSEAEKLLRKLQQQAVEEVLLEKINNRRASGELGAVHKALIDKFMVRDFFEGIKDLPDKCIDICEIDPPYGIELHDIKGSMDEAGKGDEYREVDPFRYRQFVRDMAKECYRVMTDHSFLIFWFAAEPWQEVIYEELKRAGFDLRRMPGLWVKDQGQTMRPEYYLASCTEPFYYATKGRPTVQKQGRSNVFAFKPVPHGSKIHPTERPVELIQEVLSTFAHPGSRVLVPFLGSGNTILAAANNKMDCIGFDLSQKFKDSFTVRVVEGSPGTYRSYKKDTDGLTIDPS
jgi:site-specific DNA-methyltransferase (adenine-specific)